MKWMLNVKTLEEAKRKVLESPVYGDVTFIDKKAYRGRKVVGELFTTPEGIYYFTTYKE